MYTQVSWKICAIVLLLLLLRILRWGIYQLYFHPLSKYPGPFPAKFTNLYSAYHAWRGDIHEDMWRCHEKYGEHVRYAPNRVMFCSPDAAKDIYGNRNNVIKSTVYNTLRHGGGNTLTLRNKAEHAARRRVVSSGFSDASLRLLEPKILAQVHRFVRGLLATGTNSLESKTNTNWTESRDMALWCDHHTFDLMSSLIYSASYDATSREEFRFVPHSIEQSNVRMSVILQAPELMWARLDRKLFPQSIAARDKFLKFLRTMIATRMKSKKSATSETAPHDDIFALFEKAHDPETGKKFGATELTAESATLVVAGSDTTSIALAGLFYYLSRPINAAAYRRCVQEVRTAFRSMDEIRAGGAVAAACPYLRACIEETLRMSPPTGSALWREVMTGGTSIDGHFIPAGCDVGVGIYAIHHNAALFPEPFEFRPERFLSGGENAGIELLNSRRGFMPFSIGTRGCIGKGLAMTEIMLTMACIMRVSDFRCTGNEGSEVMEGEYKLWDHITGAKEGPWLQFCSIGAGISESHI